MTLCDPCRSTLKRWPDLKPCVMCRGDRDGISLLHHFRYIVGLKRGEGDPPLPESKPA